VIAAIIGHLACGGAPTAPSQTRPPAFDPAALLGGLAGSYTLTFEADDSCPVPASLKALSYDVSLEPTRFRYLAVLVPHRALVADLWVSDREEDGFTLRWNVDCEVPDSIGTTSFYLCGEGAAFPTDGAISGVIHKGDAYLDRDHQPFCTIGSHRLSFDEERDGRRTIGSVRHDVRAGVSSVDAPRSRPFTRGPGP
jgi:hypothetical protein